MLGKSFCTAWRCFDLDPAEGSLFRFSSLQSIWSRTQQIACTWLHLLSHKQKVNFEPQVQNLQCSMWDNILIAPKNDPWTWNEFASYQDNPTYWKIICEKSTHDYTHYIETHFLALELEALPCWYSILVLIIFSGSAILNTWYMRSWYPLNHTHLIRFIIFRIKTQLGYYTLIIPIFRHPFPNAQSETPEEAERTQIKPTLEHHLSSGRETPRLVDDD